MSDEVVSFKRGMDDRVTQRYQVDSDRKQNIHIPELGTVGNHLGNQVPPSS